MHRRVVAAFAAVLVATAALTAAPAVAGGKKSQKPLRILVTNDDGVGAPGISDAQKAALKALGAVEN